jgi:hypothetical protein
MLFKINDPVRWTSSNKHKTGVIVGVVPAGKMPRDIGVSVGDTSLPRGHESYVVRGNAKGAKPSLYWPLVSLLQSIEGLTPDEIAWCHAHAPRVRQFISEATQTPN